MYSRSATWISAPKTNAWQEKLFKEGDEKEAASSVKFDVQFDGKNIDLVRGATLPISVQSKLIKAYPGLSTAHFQKDCRVRLTIGLNGKPFYLTVNELQNVLTTGIPYAVDAAPQTSAADFFRKDGKVGDEKLHGEPGR